MLFWAGRLYFARCRIRTHKRPSQRLTCMRTYEWFTTYYSSYRKWKRALAYAREAVNTPQPLLSTYIILPVRRPFVRPSFSRSAAAALQSYHHSHQPRTCVRIHCSPKLKFSTQFVQLVSNQSAFALKDEYIATCNKKDLIIEARVPMHMRHRIDPVVNRDAISESGLRSRLLVVRRFTFLQRTAFRYSI
jgi:hypothetical protein